MTSKKWHINILKELDAKILKENSELLLIMTATLPDKTSDTSAVLFLRLPSNNGKKSLNFKDEFYIAKYPKSLHKHMNFDKGIEFSNLMELSKAQITLSGK